MTPFRFVLLCLLLFTLNSKAQSPLIAPYIDAWKVSDTSQSHSAEKAQATLKTTLNTSKHKQLLKSLYLYLQENPDKRLQVRVLLFDVLGTETYGLKITAKDYDKIREAIKIATKLQDKQLLSEVYAIAGQIDLDGGFLLYSLKALELQKTIGVEHFPFMFHRFFNVSYTLYTNAEYRQSINFGLAGLKLKKVKTDGSDPHIYIFQLDILGTCYKQVKQYDSAKFYYQQIINTIKQETDPNFKKLWLAIAKGDMGSILALEGKDSQAIPLIKEHLSTSINLKDWDNVAIAQNNLAQINFKHKQYTLALQGFKNAYYWAFFKKNAKQKLVATKGLADTYRITNKPDSAYKYDALNYQQKDSLRINASGGKLAVMNAKIAFDNTLSDLEVAESTIKNQKYIRDLILIGFVLLTIILWLLYNRNKIKAKYLFQRQQQKEKEAMAEVENFRQKINFFSKNIIEKDQLIHSLKKTLNAQVKPNKETIVTLDDTLLDYVLTTDREWVRLKEMITNAYPSFYNQLKNQLNNVTPAEKRLVSLISLGITDRQIANMLGISKDSVARSKRRLKHRLNLAENAKLDIYIKKMMS